MRKKQKNRQESPAANHCADDLWFGKDLSTPDPIPQAAINRAVALMQTGRLHRYGEQESGFSEVSMLEQEFAAYVGSRYCVALNSCGAAMFVALKTLGVRPGDKVLTSAFTLAPVPGAIAHVGASAILVETTADYTTDLADLERKARDSGAKALLISHMRGHITDLQAVKAICDTYNIPVLEDCAHTMGARWDGQHTGTWGHIGCYSGQTYKHINAGEGGLLVTNDEDIAAQAILMSGCYMLYDQHVLRPAPDVFERWRYLTPNFSMRMSNLTAALLRPQIELLKERGKQWNRIYNKLAEILASVPSLALPKRSPKEEFVASSIQFSMRFTPQQCNQFVEECARKGLYIKWFGAPEPIAFTSNYSHWHYLDAQPGMQQTQAVLQQLFDLRIPLSLTDSDCACIGQIVRAAASIADTSKSLA